jgi:outer membrane lipoprotein-sorting protein
MLFRILCLLIALSGFYTSLIAQNDPQAEAILFTAYQKYKTYQNVKIDFTCTNENKERGLKQTYTGSGHIQGIKYRIQYPDREMITDGANIWTYYKAAKQVHINTYNNKDGLLTPDEVFREDFLTSGLVYKYIGDNSKELGEDLTANQNIVDIIGFQPKDNKRQYIKFRVHIDRKSKLMNAWEVFLKNGGTIFYRVKITPNTKIPANHFILDEKTLPKDTKVTDFRKK